MEINELEGSVSFGDASKVEVKEKKSEISLNE
jgi:hypothetical protein